MLFYKENRWCVINITEKEFMTYAEIWVAPTIQAGEFKPVSMKPPNTMETGMGGSETLPSLKEANLRDLPKGKDAGSGLYKQNAD